MSAAHFLTPFTQQLLQKGVLFSFKLTKMGSPYACLNIIVLDLLGGGILTERYIVYSGGNSFLTLEEI